MKRKTKRNAEVRLQPAYNRLYVAYCFKCESLLIADAIFETSRELAWKHGLGDALAHHDTMFHGNDTELFRGQVVVFTRKLPKRAKKR